MKYKEIEEKISGSFSEELLTYNYASFSEKQRNQLIHLSVHHENLPLFELISRFGIDVNAKKDRITILHRIILTVKSEECAIGMFKIIDQDGLNLSIKIKVQEAFDDVRRVTPIFFAVMKNRRGLLFELLRAKAAFDPSEILAVLRYAIEKDNRACWEIIQKSQHQVQNYVNEKGETFLMYAAEKGALECIRLLAVGEAIGKVSSKGLTALMYAVKNNHLQCIEELISRGADVNFCSNNLTPLMYAVILGGSETVRVLLSYPVNLNIRLNINSNKMMTPLMVAVSKNYSDMVSILVDRGADTALVNGRGETALLLALLQGGVESVKKLLGAYVVCGNRDLLYAVKGGSLECLQLVLNAFKINPFEVYIESCIFEKALELKRKQFIAPLFKEGVVVSIMALTIAIRDVHFWGEDFVLALIEKSSDKKNPVFGFGNSTAVRECVIGNHLVLLKKLIDKGAMADSDGSFFESLLGIACSYTDVSMLEFLLSFDGMVAKVQKLPALAIAARRGFVGHVSLLLECSEKKRLNAISSEDRGRALIIAAEEGRLEVIKRLLDQSVEIVKTNWYVYYHWFVPTTALMMAGSKGHMDVVTLLLSKGSVREQLQHADYRNSLGTVSRENICQFVKLYPNYFNFLLYLYQNHDEYIPPNMLYAAKSLAYSIVFLIINRGSRVYKKLLVDWKDQSDSVVSILTKGLNLDCEKIDWLRREEERIGLIEDEAKKTKPTNIYFYLNIMHLAWLKKTNKEYFLPETAVIPVRIDNIVYELGHNLIIFLLNEGLDFMSSIVRVFVLLNIYGPFNVKSSNKVLRVLRADKTFYFTAIENRYRFIIKSFKERHFSSIKAFYYSINHLVLKRELSKLPLEIMEMIVQHLLPYYKQGIVYDDFATDRVTKVVIHKLEGQDINQYIRPESSKNVMKLFKSI